MSTNYEPYSQNPEGLVGVLIDLKDTLSGRTVYSVAGFGAEALCLKEDLISLMRLNQLLILISLIASAASLSLQKKKKKLTISTVVFESFFVKKMQEP